jgi:predicted RNA binding protein YcfA (HicA-like mRNA interferase family)
MCRLLETSGGLLQRIKGSHHIYSKPGERKILSIPVHGNRNFKTGLANRMRAMPALSDSSRPDLFTEFGRRPVCRYGYVLGRQCCSVLLT